MLNYVYATFAPVKFEQKPQTFALHWPGQTITGVGTLKKKLCKCL